MHPLAPPLREKLFSFCAPFRRSLRRRGGAGDSLLMRTAAYLCARNLGRMPPKKPPWLRSQEYHYCALRVRR